MAKRSENDLRVYAVVGAEQRLLELAEEAARIFKIFPELRAPGRGFMAATRGGGEEVAASAGTAAPARRRRRRTMSAEARRRISEAQKARWAKQKASGPKKK